MEGRDMALSVDKTQQDLTAGTGRHLLGQQEGELMYSEQEQQPVLQGQQQQGEAWHKHGVSEQLQQQQQHRGIQRQQQQGGRGEGSLLSPASSRTAETVGTPTAADTPSTPPTTTTATVSRRRLLADLLPDWPSKPKTQLRQASAQDKAGLLGHLRMLYYHSLASEKRDPATSAVTELRMISRRGWFNRIMYRLQHARAREKLARRWQEEQSGAGQQGAEGGQQTMRAGEKQVGGGSFWVAGLQQRQCLRPPSFYHFVEWISAHMCDMTCP
jgi:hypothetical protein